MKMWGVILDLLVEYKSRSWCFEGLFGRGFTGKGEAAEFNDTTLEVYVGKPSLLLLLLLLQNRINDSKA